VAGCCRQGNESLGVKRLGIYCLAEQLQFHGKDFVPWRWFKRDFSTASSQNKYIETYDEGLIFCIQDSGNNAFDLLLSSYPCILLMEPIHLVSKIKGKRFPNSIGQIPS
jgi:hypothetical protein